MLEDSESNSSSGANICMRLQLSSFHDAYKSVPANSGGIFRVIGGVAVRGAVGGICIYINSCLSITLNRQL